MKIPVFHDDQHGTAIVVGAAVLNGLHLQGKDLGRSSWSRPAPVPRRSPARACWSARRAGREHLGHRHRGRGLQKAAPGADGPDQGALRQEDRRRKLAEVIGAPTFLGLSAGGVLKGEMVAKMAANPLILALANPTRRSSRRGQGGARDAIIATGRSDYPNQVNNVLCFRSSSAARSTWARPPSPTR